MKLKNTLISISLDLFLADTLPLLINIYSSTDRCVSFYQNSSVGLDSISPWLISKPGWLKHQARAANHLATRRYDLRSTFLNGYESQLLLFTYIRSNGRRDLNSNTKRLAKALMATRLLLRACARLCVCVCVCMCVCVCVLWGGCLGMYQYIRVRVQIIQIGQPSFCIVDLDYI